MSNPLINITRKQAYIFAGFLVVYEFLTYIANDMIMPGMIYVVNSFHGPESAIATSLTFYILGGASLQLILGPLSDSYGRRPVMMIGAILFFVFTAMIANSHSMEQFLVGRFFQGMGLCFIGVVGYATIQEIFEEMDAIRLTSVMANLSIIAPLIGPLAGAAIINHYSWRYIFVFIAFFALTVIWGFWKYMPEPLGQVKTDGEEIKVQSFNLKAIGSNYKSLLCNPAFVLGSLAEGFLVGPCLFWIALSPIMLVTVAHLSIIQYALLQIPLFAACIVGNWYLHTLTHKKSVRQIIVRGSYLVGLSVILVALLPGLFGQHYFWVIPGLILNFFALGLSNSPLIRFILFSTDVSKGTASALLSMIAMVIQGVGVLIGGAIYVTHSNRLFGVYCLLNGIFYFAALYGVFCFSKGNQEKL